MDTSYIHLSDHIYIAQFKDEFILFDTKKDKYSICFKKFSDLVTRLLDEAESNSGKEIPINFDDKIEQTQEIIDKLIKECLLIKKDTPFPFYIDRKINSQGVSHADWKLPNENNNLGFNFTVLKSFLSLVKVHFYMKAKGLYSTIQLLKKSKINDAAYTIPQDDELRELAQNLNRACFLFPRRTSCLEWSISFAFLALKRKWKCNLEVGVQNYPFLSHAWVECDGKVIMNSQELREELAIIINEPFRRLKA